jgi:hypothetical protein
MISIVNRQQSPLFLVEIQGKIELLSTDLRLGELGFEDNEPRLMIGNHIIQGKRVVLKNPILVVEKGESDKGKVLNCRRIIREKLLFNSRPEHIIDRNLLC